MNIFKARVQSSYGHKRFAKDLDTLILRARQSYIQRDLIIDYLEARAATLRAEQSEAEKGDLFKTLTGGTNDRRD